MRILVATSHPSGSNVALEKFVNCLSSSLPGRDDSAWCLEPSRSDAVFFVDDDYIGAHNIVQRLISHPLARRFAGRCYRYSNTDWPAPYIPGIFPSLTPQTLVPGRSCSSHYLSSQAPQVPEQYVEETGRDWLYSFVGRTSTAAVRKELMTLDDARGLCTDVTEAPHHPRKRAEYRDHYWTVLARSKFILCPRGYGASSFRLFEAMQCGRVPVIISDQWIPPPGPDWSRISTRVPENRIYSIPEILAELEPHAEEMGRQARAAWLRWFSDARTPETMLGYLQSLARGRDGSWTDATLDVAWSLRFLAQPIQLRSAANYLLLGLGLRRPVS